MPMPGHGGKREAVKLWHQEVSIDRDVIFRHLPNRTHRHDVKFICTILGCASASNAFTAPHHVNAGAELFLHAAYFIHSKQDSM